MNESVFWLLRCGNQVLTVIRQAPENVFPFGRAADIGNPNDALLIGEWQGRPCFAAEFAQLPDNVSGELMTVGRLYSRAGDEAFALAGRATQLLDWQKNHRFCGRCGIQTEMKSGEFAMTCPSCGLLAFPRITPAVMVVVQRGDELLLARSPHFKPGVFSALAGFVEAGETLEQCVTREVREEVGIEITNLRFFRSQSWPFPNSLMVAFLADYAGGNINPDPLEIEAAQWFSLSALPLLPDPVSISRHLIDAVCQHLQAV